MGWYPTDPSFGMATTKAFSQVLAWHTSNMLHQYKKQYNNTQMKINWRILSDPIAFCFLLCFFLTQGLMRLLWQRSTNSCNRHLVKPNMWVLVADLATENGLFPSPFPSDCILLYMWTCRKTHTRSNPYFPLKLPYSVPKLYQSLTKHCTQHQILALSSTTNSITPIW